MTENLDLFGTQAGPKLARRTASKGEQMSLPLDSKRIKRLREERGWKQEELAERAGLSVGTIQNVEAGRGVSVETRARIAKALGVDARDIGAKAPRPGPGLSLDEARSEVLRFVRDRKSVNLVGIGGSGWREVIHDIQNLGMKKLAIVDIGDEAITTRKDLVEQIEALIGGSRPQSPRVAAEEDGDVGDLLRLKQLVLDSNIPTYIIFTHFDHVCLKSTGFQDSIVRLLFTLRNLEYDHKKLIMIIHTHKPLSDLIALDPEGPYSRLAPPVVRIRAEGDD
jgi:transcriptional regulator with XRE-family HTH domain